jgi:hypothetical protein
MTTLDALDRLLARVNPRSGLDVILVQRDAEAVRAHLRQPGTVCASVDDLAELPANTPVHLAPGRPGDAGVLLAVRSPAGQWWVTGRDVPLSGQAVWDLVGAGSVTVLSCPGLTAAR